MIGKVTPELLARYLDSSTTPLDPALIGSPEVTAQLADLAEVAHAIAPPPPIELDPQFRANGRLMLLNSIVEERETRRRSLLWRLRQPGWGSPARTPIVHRPYRLNGLPGFGLGLALIATATLGTGVVRAAADSYPGDTFYPMKLTIEGLGVSLATSDQARAQALLAVADERLAEARDASRNGLVDATTVAAGAYVDELTEARPYLARTEGMQDTPGLATTVSVSLAKQQATLAAAEVQAAPAAQPALTIAGRALTESLAIAQAGENRATPAALVATAPGRDPGRTTASVSVALATRAGEPTRAANLTRVGDPSRVAMVTLTPAPSTGSTAKTPDPGDRRGSGDQPHLTPKPTPAPVVASPTPAPTEVPLPPRDDRTQNDHPRADRAKDDQVKTDRAKIEQAKADQAKVEQARANQAAGGKAGIVPGKAPMPKLSQRRAR